MGRMRYYGNHRQRWELSPFDSPFDDRHSAMHSSTNLDSSEGDSPPGGRELIARG